jgi:hypothetical protein
MTALMVKVGQLPGKITEVAVEPGSTVSQVLALAGIQVGNDSTLTLNGEPTTPATSIRSNGTVLVTKKIKGA